MNWGLAARWRAWGPGRGMPDREAVSGPCSGIWAGIVEGMPGWSYRDGLSFLLSSVPGWRPAWYMRSGSAGIGCLWLRLHGPGRSVGLLVSWGSGPAETFSVRRW